MNIKQDLEEEMAKASDDEAKALKAYKDTQKESQESMAAMEKSWNVSAYDTAAAVST